MLEQQVTKKTCTKCGEAKTRTEFGKSKQSSDGLLYHCKVCVTAYYAGRQDQLKRNKAAQYRVPKICAKCGADFLTTASEVNRGSGKYCSKECGNAPGRNGTVEERFWEKVDKTPGYGPWGDCWRWTGAIGIKGYGHFCPATGVHTVAHRFGYELINGPIPDGLNALHRCDTPACVRADHIFLGTLADNNADMRAKGRQWTKLSEDDVREIRRKLANGMTMQSIADLYGVSQGLISHIKHGRAWINR